jgi:hypothetical protein
LVPKCSSITAFLVVSGYFKFYDFVDFLLCKKQKLHLKIGPELGIYFSYVVALVIVKINYYLVHLKYFNRF